MKIKKRSTWRVFCVEIRKRLIHIKKKKSGYLKIFLNTAKTRLRKRGRLVKK